MRPRNRDSVFAEVILANTTIQTPNNSRKIFVSTTTIGTKRITIPFTSTCGRLDGCLEHTWPNVQHVDQSVNREIFSSQIPAKMD